MVIGSPPLHTRHSGLVDTAGGFLQAPQHVLPITHRVLCDRYGGYYTVKANPTLRIVSLNGNYYLKANFCKGQLPLAAPHHYATHTRAGIHTGLIEQNSTGADVAGQLTWLDNILMQASQANEQVFIIAHEPPGKQGSEDACKCDQI